MGATGIRRSHALEGAQGSCTARATRAAGANARLAVHGEPPGRANARPMTGSTEAINYFFATARWIASRARNDGEGRQATLRLVSGTGIAAGGSARPSR